MRDRFKYWSDWFRSQHIPAIDGSDVKRMLNELTIERNSWRAVAEQRAAQISTLAQEVERLRGALEVYAKAEHWHSLETDDNMAWEAWNKFEHGYDTARAALAPHECAGDYCDRGGGE